MRVQMHIQPFYNPDGICTAIYVSNGSIFGKRYLLAIDHIMLALFGSYVPNMNQLVDM